MFGNIPNKVKKLIEENIVLNDHNLVHFFETAEGSGLLAVENENNSAILKRGIFYLNGDMQPYYNSEDLQDIFIRLIKKYQCFRYKANCAKGTDKLYEYNEYRKNWDLYSKI